MADRQPIELHEAQDNRFSTDVEATSSMHEVSVAPGRFYFVQNRWNQYLPASQRTVRNSLLAGVGYLEFTNALDYPANVWNEIPTPIFAIALMGLGGSIALIMSAFAFADLRLCSQNLRILRRERAYLLNQKTQVQSWPVTQDSTSQTSRQSERLRLIDTWLSLNYRELGWELGDRLTMDLLLGFASILVGIGTLLAIWGANPSIFLASNLLSGYVGNAPVALYGILNAFWCIFAWRRFRKHHTAVMSSKDNALRANPILLRHFQRHIHMHLRYAVISGVTTLVAAVGSLMTATLWYGYVILIPCIFSSIYTNRLWRHNIGFDREPVFIRQESYRVSSLFDEVKFAVAAQKLIDESKPASKNSFSFAFVTRPPSAKAPSLVSELFQLSATLSLQSSQNMEDPKSQPSLFNPPKNEDVTRPDVQTDTRPETQHFSVVNFLLCQGLYDEFCLHLLRHHLTFVKQLTRESSVSSASARASPSISSGESIEIDAQILMRAEQDEDDEQEEEEELDAEYQTQKHEEQRELDGEQDSCDEEQENDHRQDQMPEQFHKIEAQELHSYGDDNSSPPSEIPKQLLNQHETSRPKRRDRSLEKPPRQQRRKTIHDAATTFLLRDGAKHFQYRERMLWELLGSWYEDENQHR